MTCHYMCSTIVLSLVLPLLGSFACTCCLLLFLILSFSSVITGFVMPISCVCLSRCTWCGRVGVSAVTTHLSFFPVLASSFLLSLTCKHASQWQPSLPALTLPSSSFTPSLLSDMQPCFSVLIRNTNNHGHVVLPPVCVLVHICGAVELPGLIF